jgi:DNA polymerase III delta prime subunit
MRNNIVKIKYQEEGFEFVIDFKDARTKHLEYMVENTPSGEMVKVLRKLRNSIRDLRQELEEERNKE